MTPRKTAPLPKPRRIYRYEGISRNGNTIGGRTSLRSPAEFVEAKYEAGWSSLTIWPNLGKRDEPVGGINLHPANGRRTWWSES